MYMPLKSMTLRCGGEKQLEHWKEALKYSAGKSQSPTSLAWSQFRSRDYESAIKTITNAPSTRTAEVQFLYGASLLNLQKPAEALPYIETALNSIQVPARAGGYGSGSIQTGKADQAIPLLKARAIYRSETEARIFSSSGLINSPTERTRPNKPWRHTSAYAPQLIEPAPRREEPDLSVTSRRT